LGKRLRENLIEEKPILKKLPATFEDYYLLITSLFQVGATWQDGKVETA